MVMRGQSDMVEDVVLAEASAWLARLQGPARTPAAEAAFKAWLAADPAHARAFARVTDTWDIIPGATLMSAASPPRRSRRVPMALAAALALLTLVTGLVWLLPRDLAYQTAVGEQRTVTLGDGTRIALNTDTRLAVDYGDDLRRVRLERGEALFEVARQPRRPFIVLAGDEQVRALGTSFVVRRDPDRLTVALIEGKVEVGRRVTAPASARPAQATVLAPGERITVRADDRRELDKPRIEAMTAWRRGEVMFDDATLAEAVVELNRYGGSRIRLEDPALEPLRVSGVFTTRDPAEFARTIAELHGLDVEHGSDGVVLRR